MVHQRQRLKNRSCFGGPGDSLMQSELPTNTRDLGRSIGQPFGPIASKCDSTPPHCFQSIHEKRFAESPGVAFAGFRTIRSLPSPMNFRSRRLSELASFRKDPRAILFAPASGIPLKLASFSQHLKPLLLQHLAPQIGFVREIAIFSQLASFRRGAACRPLSRTMALSQSSEAVSPGNTAGYGRKR